MYNKCCWRNYWKLPRRSHQERDKLLGLSRGLLKWSFQPKIMSLMQMCESNS